MDAAAKFRLQCRRIFESYQHTHGLASHQVESYEHFLHYMLPGIILEPSPITIPWAKQRIVHRIFLSNMWLKKPTIRESNGFVRELRPREAHLRKQTYAFDVFVDVTHKVYGPVLGAEDDLTRLGLKEHRVYKSVLFCQIPCMLGSSACHLHGDLAYPLRREGTFCINGYEKALITQDHMRCNMPFVFKVTGQSKHSFKCEVRSFHATKIRSTSTLYIFLSEEKATSVPEITVMVPFIKHPIPLPVIFRLLGVPTVRDMVALISPENSQVRYRAQSILGADSSGTGTMSSEELYNWIGLKGSTERQRRKRIQYIRHIFANEFLPHCTTKGGDAHREKAFYLAYCVRKLLRVFVSERNRKPGQLAEYPPDDKDNYANKRCCTAGLQIALLLRQLVRNFVKMLHMQVFKSVVSGKFLNIVDFFNHRKISGGLKYAFATGNWAVQKSASTNQVGICQAVNNMNLLARLSHIRMVNTPLSRDYSVHSPKHRKCSPKNSFIKHFIKNTQFIAKNFFSFCSFLGSYLRHQGLA